jgi:hypothetical protein
MLIRQLISCRINMITAWTAISEKTPFAASASVPAASRQPAEMSAGRAHAKACQADLPEAGIPARYRRRGGVLRRREGSARAGRHRERACCWRSRRRLTCRFDRTLSANVATTPATACPAADTAAPPDRRYPALAFPTVI